MRIGYSVEDSTHRAILVGLQTRWCPEAEMEEGRFRGSTKQSRHREIPRIVDELAMKSVDVMVFLTDSDGRPWREIKGEEEQRIPAERIALLINGVADRNGECWICSDADYVAARCGGTAAHFRVADPKGPFEGAFGISSLDRKEAEIAELVREAPLNRWLQNASFEDFYEQARDVSQRLGCAIENLRER